MRFVSGWIVTVAVLLTASAAFGDINEKIRVCADNVAVDASLTETMFTMTSAVSEPVLARVVNTALATDVDIKQISYEYALAVTRAVLAEIDVSGGDGSNPRHVTIYYLKDGEVILRVAGSVIGSSRACR